MDVLRIMINDPFKESFHEKIKKIINVLTIFLIFYKSCVKTFLKWIINYYLKGIVLRALVSIDP